MSLFFDRMGRYTILFFVHMARFSTLVLSTLRASARVPLYLRIIFAQMMSVGVRSLPIVVFTSDLPSDQAETIFEELIRDYVLPALPQ